MRLWLLRHAITPGPDILKGQGIDDPLDQAGREHARRICEHVAGYHITHLYSSPLLRAVETATPIGRQHRLEVILLDELKEINLGTFTGKPVEMDPRRILNNWDYDFSPHSGESPAQIQHRVEVIIEHVKAHGPQAHVMAVTHAGIIRAVYRFQGLPTPYPIPNGSVHAFTF